MKQKIRLWENGVKKCAASLGERELGQWVSPVALVWHSSLQLAHREFILAIFPVAQTFLHTFCVADKKYVAEGNNWYNKFGSFKNCMDIQAIVR